VGSYSNVIICVSQSKVDQMRDGCVKGAKIACLTCACGVLQLPVGPLCSQLFCKSTSWIRVAIPSCTRPYPARRCRSTSYGLLHKCFLQISPPRPMDRAAPPTCPFAPDFFCYVTGWIGVAISLCMRPHHLTLTLYVARSHI